MKLPAWPCAQDDEALHCGGAQARAHRAGVANVEGALHDLGRAGVAVGAREDQFAGADLGEAGRAANSAIGPPRVSVSAAPATLIDTVPNGKVSGEKPGRTSKVIGPFQALLPAAFNSAPVPKMPVPDRVRGAAIDDGLVGVGAGGRRAELDLAAVDDASAGRSRAERAAVLEREPRPG